MKKTVIYLALLGLMLSGCAGPSTSIGGSTGTAESTGTTVKTETKLPADTGIMDMYRHLLDEGNFVYSPYSVRAGLRLLYPAADDTAKKELETLIGDTNDMDTLEPDDGGVLSIANRVYANQDKDLNTDILEADIEEMDFSDPGKAAKRINGWVADNTRDMITDLIPETMVSESTAVVLVNAISFLDKWQLETVKEDTVEWCDGNVYHSFSGESTLLDVKEFEDFDVIRLAYDTDQYAMYLFVNSSMDFDAVDRYFDTVTDDELADLLDFSDYSAKNLMKKYTNRLMFNIPDFQVRTKKYLSATLREMGVEECLDPETDDFERLGKGVHIDEVIHETFVDASNKGTQAAAATVVLTKDTAAKVDTPPMAPKRVIADTTFTFVIKDEPSGTILFIGRIEEPTNPDEDFDAKG